MRRMQFGDISTDGFAFHLYEVEDFEFQNPIEKLREQISEHSIHSDFDSIQEEQFRELISKFGFKNVITGMNRSVEKNYLKRSAERINEVLSTKLPENMINILTCNNKKEQFKILRNLKLNQEQLIQFTFKAYLEHNFTHSSFKFEHLPKGIDKKLMPRFVYMEDDGKIISSGNTPYSEGQLRQIIEQRKVVVTKFIECGELWHCFFYTYKALGGKEAGGKRHMHYVSNTWNFTREEAINELKEKHYPFSSVPHIEYTE